MPLILVKKTVDPLTAATSGNINEESKAQIDFNNMSSSGNRFSLENQRAMTTLEDEITGQATYLQFNKKSKHVSSLIREIEDERQQVLRSNKANFKS